jgi:hypothetical protein
VTKAFAAFAQTAPAISSAFSAAQFQKLLRLIDTAGAKDSLPAPRGSMLGLGTDSKGDVPCVEVDTGDDRYSLARSAVDPKEFMVLADAGNDTAYLFSTHADFRPIKAIVLHAAENPKVADPSAPETQALFQKAIVAWRTELDKK